MELIKKYKTILIALAVIALAGLAYMYFRGTDVPTDSSLVYDNTATAEPFVAGQEILGALEELRRLRIDTTFFDNNVFKSLVDLSSATTSEPIGRPDPFESLPKKKTDTSGVPSIIPKR